MRTRRLTMAAGMASVVLLNPLFAAEGVPGGAAVLIEAEAFDDYGGWVDDSQFMDEMGSPFLLAHGLGVPVEDATTTVRFPATGMCRVWVRTRDWVAPWKAPGAPGRFQLIVDGRLVATDFGTEGAQWHWQDGGELAIGQNVFKVALNDLTGFEGRCDAILLTTDMDFKPPNRDPAMAALRRTLLGGNLPGGAQQPDDAGRFDLVVVGGGIAGTCAALSAARLDLKVALVQDRPVLGGNNSSEVRVWLNGVLGRPPYPRVGDVVKELEQQKRAHYGPDNTAEIYEDDKKLAVVEAEKNITLFLGHRANGAQTDDGRLTAVIAQNTRTSRRIQLVGRWFADCTGDGCLGALAGADFEITRKGHMGRCNLWNVVQTDRPQPFPRCPWALDLSDKPFPGRGDDKRGLLALGGWYWESGFDRDPIAERELIRDNNFRAMYGAWDALKNVDRVYPNHKLNWAAHISGPRESRRLLGDVVLSKEDLIGQKKYPDGCVPTGWKMDLHLPDKRYEKGFQGDAFISKAHYTDFPQPYWVPYRCLYSRNVPNLLMAGRDVSVTHEALGSVRVMRTCGMMGEIVGMAAWLCKEHDTDPRGVYRDHLSELQGLMRRGVGKVTCQVLKLRQRAREVFFLSPAGPRKAFELLKEAERKERGGNGQFYITRKTLELLKEAKRKEREGNGQFYIMGQDLKLPDAPVSLALLYEEAKDHQNAKTWMVYATARSPNSLTTQTFAARWALETGEIELAEEYLAAAEKIDPDAPELKTLKRELEKRRVPDM